MKFFFKFLCLLLCTNLSLSELFCQQKKEPPQEIQNNPSYILEPITYSGVQYGIIKISNQIFLNKDNTKITSKSTFVYNDTKFCPDGFIIPRKGDYESIISQLGENAYSTFTDPNGFNMQEGKYYLTNTRGEGELTFNKMFMYLDGTDFKFIDYAPNSPNTVCRCMLDLIRINLIFPNIDGDPKLNQTTKIAINKEKYAKGFLWKIDDKIFTTNEIEYTFEKSGMHTVEFWGNYINDETLYLCENIFIKGNPVKNSQDNTFSDEYIKKIETNFEMEYKSIIHFTSSNSPVAPRIDGGYYIAFMDKSRYLHVLSYDINDTLIKDFNTNEKAYPIDITSTDYGFAIYMRDEMSVDHSYLNSYDNNFALIKTVQIMNNKETDDSTIPSNLVKQIIKYDDKGNPIFGMNFMFDPDNGKLVHSRGRIFLIFCHYNHFIDGRGDHTGDTVVTFNDILTDMDFGITWGTSHSLIQSATFDENYFWTAALGDANPYGIRVEYTSKTEFNSDYDPINKKYNSRINSYNDALAGYIKGYANGLANGRLGGILHFSELGLYCLVYAKTPDVDKGKHVIYLTTWKFIDNQITNIQTHVIKTLQSNYVAQVRAGLVKIKYLLFIMKKDREVTNMLFFKELYLNYLLLNFQILKKL